ncbi:MAG: hypothetical protein KTR19_09360 [Hyphomicrobiales bacterium]|nr:hypothetical protein [Hyphomicrobiales bacterium]
MAESLHSRSGSVAHLAGLHMMVAILSQELPETQCGETPIFSRIADLALVKSGWYRPVLDISAREVRRLDRIEEEEPALDT